MATSTSLPASFSAWQIKGKPAQVHHLSVDALNNLELAKVPIPELPPGYALVRIHAVSLNSRDLYTVSQSPLYPCPLEAGTSPCSDGAGVVVAAGPESKWTPGSRVLLVPSNWLVGNDAADFDITSCLGGKGIQGTLREYALVKDDWLISAPSNLTLEEVATIPCATATALQAILHGPIKTSKGHTVLTQGTGGVSIAAIKIALALGCTVIATSSSPEKLEFLKSLGIKHVINYRTHPEWSKQVLQLTGGKGVDLVVDVGGSSTMLQSLASTRQGGGIALCGILGEGDETGVTPNIMYGAKKVQGILGSSKNMLEQTVQLSKEHDIHPVIAKVVDFRDAKTAFETLMSQKEIGKIVIKVASE